MTLTSLPCDWDAQRMHTRLELLGISFRKLVCGQGVSWLVRPSAVLSVPVVLDGFGDANFKDRWGVLKLSMITVWLECSVSLTAVGLGTKLVEASMVVFAILAIADHTFTVE